MKCAVTRGHNGTYIVTAEDGKSGTFHPFRCTITGARDKHGQVKLLTASKLQTHLRIRGALRKPNACVHLPDDRGIFDTITAVDIYQNLRKAYLFMEVPLKTLQQVVKLCK